MTINEKLLKPYDPKETEDRIYKTWEDSGFFQPENLPNVTKETFTIVIPPPNVTGSLHMGHALNSTIQDILIRQKRMSGYKTLWIPGTDHAGIATQNVVEKDLKKQNISRHDLGKEKFLEKVWEWKDKYGDIILNQFKKLGASCDWSRTAFTMDPSYAKAVEETFLHYHKKGWIYQGDRVVNWCKRCQTSLSDLELEYENTKGKLWYLRYPIKETELSNNQSSVSKWVVVATTRPETMLGDTAVAVNSKDERYKNLIGKTLILPITNREIPIIGDDAIEMEFGTGAVKVTPAHDMLDFEIGERNKLPIIQVIDKYGKMSDLAGKEYVGLNTQDAREKIIKELEKQNLIEKIDDYDLRVSKCYRCNSIIEPQISKQWFLKMSELAKMAIKSVENGEVVFHPKKWEKVYLDWMNNIRDWCISRQIWWGHKIPIDGVDDVLDTWFSSALWPFATLGWPNDKSQISNLKSQNDLDTFYPTQVLSTARDIINLWVARMVFSSEELLGMAPFKDVIIHPTILTKDGKRMSKSLGTGIDPIELINKHGADATRFGLIYQMMGGQDIHFSEDAIVAGKKFANKLWNISRFVLQNANSNLKTQISKLDIQNSKLEKENEEIINKLEEIINSVNKDISEYNFGQALHALYDFAWHDFADKYIEYSKTNNSEETKQVLSYALVNILKLLHPFMPFITEEIWSTLPDNKNLLIIEKWPM